MSTTAPKVLVVEADESLKSLMAALLEDEGYEGHIVDSVPEALDVMERSLPSLILLDMDQLEEQSEELVSAVRARRGRQVPIAIIGPRYEVSALAQAVGADASLTKPFDIDAFIDLVARLTKNQRD